MEQTQNVFESDWKTQQTVDNFDESVQGSAY